ncbi:MAG: M20/M25/M40 family metallo-hydrolase [Saprospiraceae bacterium]|nr:M20/M25/M40 family metallo-hydrolase [Saprospiraceae bacterium]
MMNLYRIAVLAFAMGCIIPCRAQGEDEASDRATVRHFFDEALTKQQSYEWLKHLCLHIGPRLSGSKNAARAIKWVKDIADSSGFDNVHLQDVMVPYWERGPQEMATLTDSRGTQHPLSVLAIGGSIATPGGGVSGQVLEVESLEAAKALSRLDVEGRILFYNPKFDRRNIMTGASYGANVGTRSSGAVIAAEKGAIASVIRSVTSSNDDIPHTGTSAYREGVKKIPAAALGVRSADLISEIIARDPDAILQLKIQSKWNEDAPSHNVVAEIRGSELPEEIIVVGGHLDSWDVGHGAHDDGAGCMHALGALRLLVTAGIQPRRTIRAVMFINEENGTRGGEKYAALAVQKGEKHLMAIESDAGGFTPRGFGVSASDAQREKMQQWLSLFPRNTISYFSRGGGGVDIGPLHRADGTPMMGLVTDTQRMFDLHHSAKDTFDQVHPREMELGTASLATIIYLLDKYGL